MHEFVHEFWNEFFGFGNEFGHEFWHEFWYEFFGRRRLSNNVFFVWETRCISTRVFWDTFLSENSWHHVFDFLEHIYAISSMVHKVSSYLSPRRLALQGCAR